MVNIIALGKKAVDFGNKLVHVNLLPQSEKGTRVMAAMLPMGGISKAPSVIARAGGAIKTAAQSTFRRLTTNPLAGQSIKSGALKLGAGALGVLGSIKAFQTTRAVAKGEKPNLVPNINEVLSATSTAYNPFAAVGGLATGLFEKGGMSSINEATRVWDATRNKMVDIRESLPQYSFPNITYPDFQMPDFSSAVSFAAPSFQAPSFDISPSVGGGSGMAEMLALLGLGGGLLGGYALGRRKRRKKKYKKRKKH